MKQVPKSLYFLSFLCLLLAVNLVLHSCKKESISPDIQQAPAPTPATSQEPPQSFPRTNVEYSDGRLKFATEADLQQTLKALRENQQNLSGFESQFQGFVSNRMAFEQFNSAPEQYSAEQMPDVVWLRQDGDEVFAEPAVAGLLISCIANANAIFQVGQSIIKVGHENIYTIPLDAWRAAPPGQQANQIPGVQAMPITISSSEFSTDRNTTCEQYYGGMPSSRKMWAGIETVGCGPYSEIRVSLKHYKRGFLGRWYRKDAQRMAFHGAVTYSYSNAFNGPFHIETTMSGTNTSWLYDVLDSYFCLLCPQHCYQVLRPTRVDYQVLCDDNQVRSCSTIE